MPRTKDGVGVAGTIVGLTIVAGVLSIGACGGAASRFTGYIERGQAYFAKGDYSHASIEFRNAMQILPNDPTARVKAGEAAEKLGRLPEAASLYQSVVESSPDNVPARANLGRLYLLAGAPDRAMTLIAPVLTKHPDDPDLLLVRAGARLQTKDYPGSRTDAERVLKLSPTNEDAIGLLAGLYLRDGRPADAVRLLDDGLKRLPDSTGLRAVLVRLYESASDNEKAEEQLRKLVEIRPTELAFRQELALFYMRTGKVDAAQHVLEEAVRALPQSGDAKLAFVSFLTSQRTRAQGEQALRSFIAHEPRNYDLRLGLGAMLSQAGAAKEAVDAYSEVAQLDGTGPAALTARDRIAEIDAAQGRYDEAGKLIAAVLEQNPRDNEALYLRSSLELEHKDPAAAIADLRSVLRDTPASVAVRRALARAYLLNGEPALAEEQLRVSLQGAPADPAIRLELAHLLLHTDRAPQAVELLERGVQTKPDDVQMREALVRAYLAVENASAARTAAEDVKVLAPKSAEGFFLAGVVAQAQQRPADAEKEFEHALQQEPGAAAPLATLTRLQVERGESPKAITRLRDILTRNPKDELALEMLGEVYISTHAFPQAISTFNGAIALNPKRWEPYRNLAVARAAGGDTAGAVAAYKAGIEAAPTEPQLVVELASYYEKQGRVDEAIAAYERLCKADPHQQLAANNLAMLLATYKTDRASLDRARDLTASFATSSDGTLLDTSGWVRVKRGEFRDAVTVLERAAALSPKSPVIHYHLAVAELETGHQDQARTNLQTALAGSTDFPGADRAREMLAGLKGSG